MRAGFTLIEMLVVVAVIAALAAISYPVISAVRTRSDISTTRQLVYAVASGITTYSAQLNAVTSKTGQIESPWALGQDHTGSYPTEPRWMDGDPRLYTAGPLIANMQARAPDWYTGFVQMTGFPVPSKRGLDNRGRILDRWRQPLHIEWKANTYGAGGFGVWSTGPDGRLSDETTIQGTTADDICTWKSE